MTDAKSAWHETGERFSSLGAKLKAHYEHQRGQEVDQSKAEVREALHRLTGALEDAFDAIGTAARDDEVKSDVKQVGQSLVTALGATFSEVSTEVQRVFTSKTAGERATGGKSDAGSGTAAKAQPQAPAATTAGGGAEPEAGDAPPATSGAHTSEQAQPPGAAAEPPRSDDPTQGAQGSPKVEPWGTP